MEENYKQEIEYLFRDFQYKLLQINKKYPELSKSKIILRRDLDEFELKTHTTIIPYIGFT